MSYPFRLVSPRKADTGLHMPARILAIITAIAFTSMCATTAGAAEVTCRDEAKTKCGVYLKAQDPAPFPGQLLTEELAIEMGLKARTCDRECKLRLDRNNEVWALKLESQKAQAAVDERAADRVIEAWQDRATAAEELLKETQAKWKHPVIWTVVGLVVGAGMAFGAVKVGRKVAP